MYKNLLSRSVAAVLAVLTVFFAAIPSIPMIKSWFFEPGIEYSIIGSELIKSEKFGVRNFEVKVDGVSYENLNRVYLSVKNDSDRAILPDDYFFPFIISDENGGAVVYVEIVGLERVLYGEAISIESGKAYVSDISFNPGDEIYFHVYVDESRPNISLTAKIANFTRYEEVRFNPHPEAPSYFKIIWAVLALLMCFFGVNISLSLCAECVTGFGAVKRLAAVMVVFAPSGVASTFLIVSEVTNLYGTEKWNYGFFLIFLLIVSSVSLFLSFWVDKRLSRYLRKGSNGAGS